MRETLKRVLNAFGPSGRENKVVDVIKEIVGPYVDTMEVDAMGDLICTKKGDGTGKRVMLAAHMDQIGFVVSGIEESGFLRVFNVGGIRMVNSLNRHVVFGNGVHGVLSHEQEGFKVAENSMRPLFIDIGAKNRAEAETKVRLGDMAVYAPDAFELGDDLMASPAMDDRVGCAVLIETMKQLKDNPNEVVAVFTVQEEVGCRGAAAAAYSVNPDMGIALDVTIAGDTPKGAKIEVACGKGPCVKILDNSVICNPRVVELMEEAGKRANIEYQLEVLTGGGTDAGAIQKNRGGVPSGVVSIACRYVHSACEVISISDAAESATLLANLLNNEIVL